MLVAGGTTIEGSIVNTAEIYDPSANSWTAVSGGMITARTRHTATLLPDSGLVFSAQQERYCGTTFSPRQGRSSARDLPRQATH